MKRSELDDYVDDAMIYVLCKCKNENPLIAWSMFIDHLDMAGRRKIGDDLEAQGRNRFTGEVKNEQQ